MPVFVVGIGNTSVRIDAPTASVAKLRAQQYFPGLYAANPTRVGSSISLADDDDGGIQFVSPNNVDEFRTRIVGASGLSGGGGGGGGMGGNGFTGPDPDDIGTGITVQAPIRPGLEQQSMRGAFQEFLRGAGGVRPNPLLANFAQGQFNPARAAFAAQQQAGLTPGVDETSQFQDFLSRAGGFGNRQLASRAIQDIAGALQGQGAGGLAEQERLMQLIDPETENQAAELFGLAQMTNTISPLVRDLRNTLAGNQQDAVFGEYARQRARGNSQNFAQFLAGRGFGGRDFASRLGF